MTFRFALGFADDDMLYKYIDSKVFRRPGKEIALIVTNMALICKNFSGSFEIE